MEKVFMLLFLIASEIYGTTSLPRAKISNGKEDKITPYFPPITINLKEPNERSVSTPPESLFQLEDKQPKENNTTNLIDQKCEPISEKFKDVYKLQIRGIVIKFSDVLKTNICKGKIGYLELFALKRIIIDEDLNSSGQFMQLTIFAPNIKIIGKRNINLNGEPGKQWQPSRALDGLMGINGNSGYHGHSGGAGGIFFALANKIKNMDSLTVEAQGGAGGPGQDGGNGGNGLQGQSANAKVVESMREILSLTGSNWKGCMFNATKCIVKGKVGYSGGQGGDGGAGGEGGKAGEIFLYQLRQNTKVRKIVFDGKSGLGGKGGRGGKGGQDGDYIEFVCCKDAERMFNKSIWPVKSSDTFGPSGQNGQNGTSSQYLSKEEFRTYREYVLIVNDYKKFLLPHIREKEITLFYNLLLENAEINSLYEPMALLDELKFTVEQSVNVTFYKSLRNRIRNYRENHGNESSDYVNALNFADAMIEINDLKDHSLVINLRKFLSVVEKGLSAVSRKLNPNQIRKEQLKIMIDETYKFIRIDTKDELAKTKDAIQSYVFKLMRNVKPNWQRRQVMLASNEESSKISFGHFLMEMIGQITTVTAALTSCALVAATKSTDPVKMFSMISDLEVALAIEEKYKADKLYLLVPKNIKETDKNRNSPMRDYQDKFLSILFSLFERIKKNSLIKENFTLDYNLLATISKWEVKKFLTELGQFLEKYNEENKSLDDVNTLMGNVNKIIKNLFDIYDQMETLEKIQVNTSNVSYKNEELQNIVHQIETIVETKNAFYQYERAYNAFKQYAFPYATLYLSDIREIKPENRKNAQIFIDTMLSNIKIMKQTLMKEDTFINNNNLMTGYLTHDNKYTGPVFIWKNETNNKIISDLLDGKEVTLTSDAREFNHNAVKFKDIRLFLRTLNDSQQNELDEKLKQFHIKMSHNGVSHYKCDKKLFVISHEAFNFTKPFESSWGKSINVDEFSNGDFMVSPFAKWSVKLGLSQGNVPLNYFQQFKNKVDLILEVEGSYILNNDSFICNTNLEAFYHRYS